MKGYKHMSEAQRMRVFFLLKGMSENGKLPHGALAKVAKIFGCTRANISQIWKQAGMARVDTLIKSPTQLKTRQCTGRPPKYSKDGLRDLVREVPLWQRTCFCDLAEQIGVLKSSLFNMISARGKGKDNGFRRHCSALKPIRVEDFQCQSTWIQEDDDWEGPPCHCWEVSS